MWFKCIIILLLCSGSVAVCQETERIFPVKKNEHLKYVSFQMNDLTFDYRVLKHYTPEELHALDEKKLSGIHFIYTRSYRIINDTDCPDFKETDIDIAELEVYRSDSHTTIVNIGNKCKVGIELISRTELQQYIHK
jgi:hypothetical protein